MTMALAVRPWRDDIQSMNSRLISGTVVVALAATLSATNAHAQLLPPGGSALTAPLPAPIPPPKIEVPVVRGSFGDRITNCLQEAAAAGVRPSRRAAYSRACANR
jgi:hypothetical protein